MVLIFYGTELDNIIDFELPLIQFSCLHAQHSGHKGSIYLRLTIRVDVSVGIGGVRKPLLAVHSDYFFTV